MTKPIEMTPALRARIERGLLRAAAVRWPGKSLVVEWNDEKPAARGSEPIELPPGETGEQRALWERLPRLIDKEQHLLVLRSRRRGSLSLIVSHLPSRRLATQPRRPN